MIIFPKLRSGNITLQEIGLLHYISSHLRDGIFDQALPEIAAATNFSVPTIHRLLARLVANGFIKIERPSVKTKAGNTPVGYKPIQLMEWGRLVDGKGGCEGEPIPNGMINNIYIPVKKGVCGIDDSRDYVESADGMGSLFAVHLVEGTVRLVLDGIEHRRAMTELVASHWARVIQHDPVKIIEPDQWLIKSGTVINFDDENAGEYFLPPCECGDDVACTDHPLGKNRFQFFPKQKCGSCMEKARSTERLHAQKEAEREYDRQLSTGTNRPLHDGDRITQSDCMVVDGVTRLTYLQELSLGKCECGSRVYYEFVKDEYGTTVSIASRCMECMQTAQCAFVNSPIQAETGSNVQ